MNTIKSLRCVGDGQFNSVQFTILQGWADCNVSRWSTRPRFLEALLSHRYQTGGHDIPAPWNVTLPDASVFPSLDGPFDRACVSYLLYLRRPPFLSPAHKIRPSQQQLSHVCLSAFCFPMANGQC